jgi:alginate O-acetyltransferase complex protein AlgI
VSLGTLAYFKYVNFFLANASAALAPLGVSLAHVDVLLPAGVSFYTFKTMSYTIDIYRRQIRPATSLRGYSTFVTFFPELIAGPIVRASVFLPQMSREIGPTAERLGIGLSIFLVGLTKKLLIADPLSTVVDPVFAAPGTYAPVTLWLAVLAYALQIYCDFSGYSDMAVGTSKTIGYDLPENFRMPYLSVNVAEFWRRWHITLSTWLRDYLYIPLGGNRRGEVRTYANLMATMLLGGLWHGASWNFVLWGALHGTALATHRILSELRGGRPLLPGPLAVVVTFLFVLLCWVPFRSPDWPTTALVLTRMFSPDAEGVRWIPTALFTSGALVALGHLVGAALERAGKPGPAAAWADAVERVLGAFGARPETDPISGVNVRFGLAAPAAAFLVTTWVLALYFFGHVGTSPFIYFQF